MIKQVGITVFFIAHLLVIGSFFPNFAYAELEQITLQLKWHHQFQFAGYYAALEKGYYEEVGIDVSIREGRPDIDRLGNLVSGEVDYLVYHPGALIARSEELPVVALAAVFQHSPLVLVSLKESNIKSPGDLADQRIMYTDGDIDVISMIHKEGVDFAAFNRLPHSWNLHDLFDGQVDVMGAYLTDAPKIARDYGYDLNIIYPQTYGVDFYGDVLYTTESEIERNPARAEAFREASLKGWEFALAHPEEIIGLILNKYGSRLTREELQYEARVTRELIQPKLVRVGHMNPGRWQHIAESLIDIGYLPAEFTLDGFLYEPDRVEVLSKMQRLVSMLVFGFVVIVIVAFVLFAIVKRLRRSIYIKSADLAELLSQFESSINSMPYLFAFLDKDFNFIKVNRFYAEADNKEPKFFIGKNHFDLYPDEENKKIFEQVVLTGEAYRADEKTFFYPDDPTRIEYFDWVLEPVLDDNKQVVGLNLVVQSVTDKVKLRQELEKNVKQFERLFNSTPTGVVVLNETGGLLDVNATFLDYTGYAKEETIGRGLIDFIRPEDRADLGRIVEAAKNQEISEKSSYYILRKDSSLLLVEGFGSWYKDVDGSILYGIGVITDISKTRAIEEKLTTLEGQYAALFNSAQDGFGFASYDGDVYECNQALCNMIGYSEAEIKRMTFYDFTPTEYHRMEGDLIRHVIETDQPVYYEKEYLTKNGQRFPVAISAFKVKGKSGTDIGLGVIIRDISEMRRAQDEIKSSEEMLRLLLESSSEGVYGVDSHGCVTFCNPSCWQILGYSGQEELVGRNMHEQIHYQFADGTHMKEEDCKIYSAIHRGESIYIGNEVFWRKDGTSFPVEYWSSPVVKNDEIVGAVVFFTDISERLEARAQLEEKELILSRAQEIAQVGSWKLSVDDNQLTWSDEGYRIFGVNPDGAELSYELFLELVHPEDRSIVADAYAESVENGLDSYHCEHRILKKDTGELRFVNEECRHFRDDNGALLYSVGTVQDITESKSQERQLRATLKEKNILLKEVHHRVKNNLQIVAGMMELQATQDAKSNFPGLKDMVSRIHTMALLHESIYKAEDIAQVEVSEYINEIIQNLEQSQTTAGQKIKFDVEIVQLKMSVDQLLPIGLFVSEALMNAVKYAFVDNGEGVILVSLQEVEGNVYLRVKDNGKGLPADLNVEIAETLGFRLLRALTQQLAGEIDFQDKNGLEVSVVFPLRALN